MELAKRIFLHRRRDDVDLDAFAANFTGPHVEVLRSDHVDIVELSLDVVRADQTLLDENGMRGQMPPTWHGVTSSWRDPSIELTADQRSAILDQMSSFRSESIGWNVDEHIAWDRNPDRPTGSGVKMVSFVRSRADLDRDEFERRYRAHVDVARRHHGGVSRYVQNLVSSPATPSSPACDAVSELWFDSLDDWRERFYTDESSAGAVGEDTTAFIDFRNTFSFVVTPRRNRTPI